MTEDEWEGFESPHEHKVPTEALKQPTRLEVIDANGRTYTNWKVKELQFSYQDNGKTLKIFVTEVQNDTPPNANA